ncbi:MAG: hypothetical protein JO026_01045 [Patescibacteria group bacterium]|nr:hypothetical protein [Patescibacteria group bacterium]
MWGLQKKEISLLKSLNSPAVIQDFLDSLPMNHEKQGETLMSVRMVLRAKKAHCIEGALVAAAALTLHGEPPLLLDLMSDKRKFEDDDHVVALYKRNGYWGAISKTNHASIRFRDPVYKTLRELALSYFHEWFMNKNGIKTLESYSRPLNLRRFGTMWLTSEEDLWFLDSALNDLSHYSLVPAKNRRFIRKADSMELRAGRIVEWPE